MCSGAGKRTYNSRNAAAKYVFQLISGISDRTHTLCRLTTIGLDCMGSGRHRYACSLLVLFPVARDPFFFATHALHGFQRKSNVSLHDSIRRSASRIFHCFCQLPQCRLQILRSHSVSPDQRPFGWLHPVLPQINKEAGGYLLEVRRPPLLRSGRQPLRSQGAAS